MLSSKTSKVFLLILILFSIIGCFFVFRPFFNILIVAMIFVAITYKPYLKLTKTINNHKNIAALLMCLIFTLLILIPTVAFFFYSYNKLSNSVISEIFQNPETSTNAQIKTIQANLKSLLNPGIDEIIISYSKSKTNLTPENENTIRSYLDKIEEWCLANLFPIIKNFISSILSFLVSIPLILITMFFFYVDGQRLMKKAMILTPFPNKYDQIIYHKFDSVSYQIIISTFVVALAQGILGAIGFAIIGLPVLIGFIVMTFMSLVPYVGTSLVWVPLSIYLMFTGSPLKGIFLMAYGILVISMIDNIIRAYMIKDKAEVSSIFIFFAILGGATAFGFWGIIYGPLIVALTITIFQIYEIIYNDELEK